ncbi:hypothetical protein BDY24DRAFT_377449 [Mrakia frigida]|uniref:uncharacterized protein n=1 Tax=Mrakia frigida TaxID=29902 RepID=UPI003FCBF612
MPSRSTNLNAPSNNAPTKKSKPDKRKRAADAAAAEAAAPKKVKVVVEEEKPTESSNGGEPSGSTLAVEGEGEGEASTSELPKKEKKEVAAVPSKPTKVNGEFLPSKEDIEQDKEISEGARLALLYATLYLRFNPSPVYRPVPTKPSKSMKSNHPLPADPWAAQHQNPLFQSDFTPPDAAFELTAKQYADKKKAFRDGKAKKGDGVTGERWKFNKAREGWLGRWVCEEGQLPTRYFNTAFAYLTSVKAPAARESLAETATTALAVVDNEEKQRRAKKVLKMLGKPVEGDESEEEAEEEVEEGEGAEGEDAEEEESGEEEEEDEDDE